MVHIGLSNNCDAYIYKYNGHKSQPNKYTYTNSIYEYVVASSSQKYAKFSVFVWKTKFFKANTFLGDSLQTSN